MPLLAMKTLGKETTMELATSPMSERQRAYRATYRSRVAGWYNGWMHVLVIYSIGFTGLYIYFKP